MKRQAVFMDNQSILPRLRDLERRRGAGSFLTPAQAMQAARAFGARVRLDGGFAQAERVVPIFDHDAPREKHIAAVELRFRPQDALTHRDILGAVLALGLERSVLGDIAIMQEQGQAILICLPHVVDFIIDNLAKAGKIGLQALRISLEDLPEAHKNIREEHGTVASLRLDAVLAEAFHCSRGAAEEYLRMGLVQLCHEECRKGSRLVEEGDMISVRGKGRIKLVEIGGETRKGRVWITLGHYV